MRRVNIIESKDTPSTHDLWLYGGKLKYFGKSGWDLVNSIDKTSEDTDDNKDAGTYSAATKSSLGLVYQAVSVDALETTDEIETVITTLNTLIANLKAAGVIATS